MFLEYASAFDYQIDIDEGGVTGYKSDEEMKKDMKTWTLKTLQEFYGFTHKDSNSGKQLNLSE